MDILYEKIADELAIQGFSVTEHFLQAHLVKEMREQMDLLLDRDHFRRAGIGKGEEMRTVERIRGDQILWIDEHDTGEPLTSIMARLDELKQALNRMLYLGINSSEFHFAYYAKGKFYEKHVDNFNGNNRRIVSVLIYLNTAERKPEDGGLLKLYLPDGSTHDILPGEGTLACFMSREIPHEVTATLTPRYSITGWWRRDNVLPGL